MPSRLDVFRSIYGNKTLEFVENSRYLIKVYLWMFGALLITGITSYLISQSESAIKFIYLTSVYDFPIIYIALFILQLVLAFYFVDSIVWAPFSISVFGFFLYSIIIGCLISGIFIIYNHDSIYLTFYICSGIFLFLSIFSFITQIDLTKISNILFQGLLVTIIATITNFFLDADLIYWVSTYIGIVTFIGLIAYDTKKLIEMNVLGNEGTEEDKKEVLLGAFVLYVDFLNLFLRLLRILGKRRG